MKILQHTGLAWEALFRVLQSLARALREPHEGRHGQLATLQRSELGVDQLSPALKVKGTGNALSFHLFLFGVHIFC